MELWRRALLFGRRYSLALSKLPRSRSSPSPPPSKPSNGRSENNRRHTQHSQRFRRRVGSATRDAAATALGVGQDWSTSYQAGSSSSGSRSSSDDETDYEIISDVRGRALSNSTARSAPTRSTRNTSLQRKGTHGASSGDSGGNTTSFHRSSSPVIFKPTGTFKPPNKPQRHASPSTRSGRQRSTLFGGFTLLPACLELRWRLPCTPFTWTFSMDFRNLGESLLLLTSLLYIPFSISHISSNPGPSVRNIDLNKSLSKELEFLCLVSFLYMIWTHSTFGSFALSSSQQASSMTPPAALSSGLSSPRVIELKRNPALLSSNKADFGYVWMSVPKNYRESRDDGIFTALLLGPLIVSALLFSSLQSRSSTQELPTDWIIDKPLTLRNPRSNVTPVESTLFSRYALVNLSTYCSAILLFHVCASWWQEGRYRKRASVPDGERSSVPRSEGRRAWYYILFSIFVSLGSVGMKILLDTKSSGIWFNLNYFEAIIASLFYQFALYMALRLAHRGFTLGELGLVCFGGTAICLEFLNLTIARIWPVTTAFIRTYRLPTPLLIFQISLIVGSFLTGFLLSPFLVLSRNIAQRPVHRLRFPQEKDRNRRYYALGFYCGTVLIVGVLIGIWTRWCLGNRDPWLWVILWLVKGRRKWSRPALLCYWALLCSISVAGWSRQLNRSRRYRPRTAATENSGVPSPMEPTPVPATSSPTLTPTAVADLPSSQHTLPSQLGSGALGMSFSNLPNLPNLPNMPTLPTSVDMSTAATEFLDAADKHVPTLGLNARRKFFHGLAVVMFIPGIAVDPAFTHLSFSVAFSLFVFTEYVRYFAVYPFGASVHLFMNEFIDHKDSGTAILSHFYLLTGCAGSVWVEGHSKILQFTGTLCLGIGDAVASIVGRRIGRHRWSTSTSKTIEGSLAFVVSVVSCAWIIRLLGYAESFSTVRYVLVVSASALLEALSDQNDNLTLPLYMWSMLVVTNL